MTTVFERVKAAVIANQKMTDPAKIALITPEATLDDLGFDSLDIVDFTIAIEEEFSAEAPGMEITSEVAESIHTLADLLQVLKDNGIDDN